MSSLTARREAAMGNFLWICGQIVCRRENEKYCYVSTKANERQDLFFFRGKETSEPMLDANDLREDQQESFIDLVDTYRVEGAERVKISQLSSHLVLISNRLSPGMKINVMW